MNLGELDAVMAAAIVIIIIIYSIYIKFIKGKKQ